MSASPTLLQKCPSDLHGRLLAAVNSESFLNELENLREKSKDVESCKFPFQAPSESDPQELQKALTKALGGINKAEKMRNIWYA